nr:hypothetical protein [Lelliottia steviae]
MNNCQPIQGLKFDSVSQRTLQKIAQKKESGNLLSAALTAGVFSSIFTKSSPAQAAYNITQTDWSLYAKSMKAVPIITRRSIEKDVEFMILHYQMHNNPKLLKFWQGVYNGCK